MLTGMPVKNYITSTKLFFGNIVKYRSILFYYLMFIWVRTWVLECFPCYIVPSFVVYFSLRNLKKSKLLTRQTRHFTFYFIFINQFFGRKVFKWCSDWIRCFSFFSRLVCDWWRLDNDVKWISEWEFKYQIIDIIILKLPSIIKNSSGITSAANFRHHKNC